MNRCSFEAYSLKWSRREPMWNDVEKIVYVLAGGKQNVEKSNLVLGVLCSRSGTCSTGGLPSESVEITINIFPDDPAPRYQSSLAPLSSYQERRTPFFWGEWEAKASSLRHGEGRLGSEEDARVYVKLHPALDDRNLWSQSYRDWREGGWKHLGRLLFGAARASVLDRFKAWGTADNKHPILTGTGLFFILDDGILRLAA